MGKKTTVRARAHFGAKSLDLTIPVSLCKEFKIHEGDIFVVDVQKKGEDIEVVYRRILKQ